jgi:pimeloyl-ACP methyl ester carboxylesterase
MKIDPCSSNFLVKALVGVSFGAAMSFGALAAPLAVHLTGGFTNQVYYFDYNDGTYDQITISATVDLTFDPATPNRNGANFTSSTVTNISGTIHVWGNATYFDPNPDPSINFDNTYNYAGGPLSIATSYEGQTGNGGVINLSWNIGASHTDPNDAVPYSLSYDGASRNMRLWVSLPYPFWYTSDNEYYDCVGSTSVSGQQNVNSWLDGLVIDVSSGKPITGASVSFGNVPATTDNTGSFSYGNIPANTYQLIITNSGYYSLTNLVTVPAFIILQTSFSLTATVPVVLVPGWRYDPHVWDNLIAVLDSHGVPHSQVWLEDGGRHPNGSLSPDLYVGKLEAALDNYVKSGYTGKVDIVCHSMGAMVTRLAMERDKDGSGVLYGNRIRQWIGIAPVNQGAAIADWSSDFSFGLLAAVVGLGYQDVSGDGAITAMQTFSPTVGTLMKLPRVPGVVYRVIAGYNPCLNDNDTACQNQLSSEFHNRWLKIGKTEARLVDQNQKVHSHAWTHYGDGVVALAQSELSGATSTDCFSNLGHVGLPRDPGVIALVLTYLTNLRAQSLNNCPTVAQLLADADIGVKATDNQGIIYQGQQQTLRIPVDGTGTSLTASLVYHGSQLALTLVTPSGTQITPGAYPVIQYSSSSNSILYVVDSPATGTWSAIVTAVDVPTNGESYSFETFLSSPLEIDVATSTNAQSIQPGQILPIWVSFFNGTNAVTGATVSADISRPDGLSNHVVFYDDGIHGGDAAANDGIYSATFTPDIPGVFNVFVTATDGSVQRVAPLVLAVQPVVHRLVLNAIAAGTNIQINWSSAAGAYVLVGATDLHGTNWYVEDVVPYVNSSFLNTVTEPVNGTHFFRLRGPQ